MQKCISEVERICCEKTKTANNACEDNSEKKKQQTMQTMHVKIIVKKNKQQSESERKIMLMKINNKRDTITHIAHSLVFA